MLDIFGQEISSDFKINPVNKLVRDYPDNFDLSTPLNSGITFYYILINGKDGLLRKASTLKYKYDFPDSTVPDSKVNETQRKFFLNTTLREYITYKDSVACVISQQPDSSFVIRSIILEDGNWVNHGEDGRRSLFECRKQFERYAEQSLQELRKIKNISRSPTDTSSFIDYLKINMKDPKEFVLDKLEKNNLVMYGEIHRRKWSWDFCTEIINDRRFVEQTGVIFMEMASNKQNEIDHFYSNDTIDKELLLNIFRDYMIDGWNDKGKFDFLIAVWTLNKNLPLHKRIKVVAVDTPRIFSEEGLKNDTIDRDVFMAQDILSYFKIKADKRNALFIVGSAHICKTRSSAGAMLTNKMPNNSYTIFTHCPRVDNFIIVHERIRQGMFDFAFYKNGDKPVALELKNSPFGKEPFDGLYFDGSGTFQDNYDGYIFLGSLDNEPNGELLLEMYNDKFIDEIDRRYKLIGSSFTKEWDIKDMSRKAVIDKILSEQTATRWEGYIKPLRERR